MLDPCESRKPTPEEQKQIRHLDKLEEAMDCDLKANCSLADEWISHLENELEKPDYCQEAKQRINRLLYHIVDGTYDQPDNAYADQE